MIPYDRPNAAKLQSQVSQAKREGSKFFKFLDNTKFFFHLLPPWGGSETLGKEVWECFGLPPIPGKKWVRHVAYKSFESTIPGITREDPVINTLLEFQDQLREQVTKMLPNPKYYVNAILVGKIGITSAKAVLEDTWEKLSPSLVTFPLSPPTYTELITHVIRAENSSAGSLVNPYASGMVGVGRTNADGRIRYFTEVFGAATPTGIVPNRYNLAEEHGEPLVASWYSSIPNLDRMFPPPSESERVNDKLTAKCIRDALLQEASKSTTQSFERTRDGAIRTNVPVGPAAYGQPTVGTPPPSAPPPPPAVTGKDIMTRDLGLVAPPTASDGKPLCFPRYTHVQTSPNSKWCAGCQWNTPCKIASGAQGAK